MDNESLNGNNTMITNEDNEDNVNMHLDNLRSMDISEKDSESMLLQNLDVNIDFDLAQKEWRKNKYLNHGTQIWRYYDNRHRYYKTSHVTYPAHTARCGYINPETGKKCTEKSYLKNVKYVKYDVDVLDGIFCWYHKRLKKQITKEIITQRNTYDEILSNTYLPSQLAKPTVTVSHDIMIPSGTTNISRIN